MKDNKMATKICLDAGHYGKYNRSPANDVYYESDVMWKLHLLLETYLIQFGFEVIKTRTNQATDPVLYDRGAYKSLENAKKACGEGYTIYDWNGNAVYS